MMTDSTFITSAIQIMINFSVYVFFILSVFDGKMKYSRIINGFIITGYVCVSTAIIVFFMLGNSTFLKYRYIALAFWIALTFFACKSVIKANMAQLLFLIFTILATQHNIMQIAQTIFDLNFIPHLFQSKEYQLLAINTLILLFFLPAMWYLFIHLFKNVIRSELDKNYWSYLFTVPLSAYLFCICYYINYSNQNNTSPLATILTPLLLNVFSFLAYVAVMKMLIKTRDSIVATQKAAIASQQILIQNEQYRTLAESINKTNRIQHDIRHHFVTLKGYIDNMDFNSSNEYIDGFLKRQLSIYEVPICENHSVDMILRYYIALAKEYNIVVKATVQLPESINIPDTDLCIIFGNLVENAVESCQRQLVGDKFISINVKPISINMLAITVTNSFDGKIIQNNDGFMSTKHNGDGIGTASIKNIVERHGGTCKFSYENNIFKVGILLVS